MSYKLLIILSTISLLAHYGSGKPHPHEKETAGILKEPNGDAAEDAKNLKNYSTYPKYKYSYDVGDFKTGDYQKHVEERDGDTVRGEYTITDPNGVLRTVKYTADDKHGYQAVISTSVNVNAEQNETASTGSQNQQQQQDQTLKIPATTSDDLETTAEMEKSNDHVEDVIESVTPKKLKGRYTRVKIQSKHRKPGNLIPRDFQPGKPTDFVVRESQRKTPMDFDVQDNKKTTDATLYKSQPTYFDDHESQHRNLIDVMLERPTSQHKKLEDYVVNQSQPTVFNVQHGNPTSVIAPSVNNVATNKGLIEDEGKAEEMQFQQFEHPETNSNTRLKKRRKLVNRNRCTRVRSSLKNKQQSVSNQNKKNSTSFHAVVENYNHKVYHTKPQVNHTGNQQDLSNMNKPKSYIQIYKEENNSQGSENVFNDSDRYEQLDSGNSVADGSKNAVVPQRNKSKTLINGNFNDGTDDAKVNLPRKFRGRNHSKNQESPEKLPGHQRGSKKFKQTFFSDAQPQKSSRNHGRTKPSSHQDSSEQGIKNKNHVMENSNEELQTPPGNHGWIKPSSQGLNVAKYEENFEQQTLHPNEQATKPSGKSSIEQGNKDQKQIIKNNDFAVGPENGRTKSGRNDQDFNKNHGLVVESENNFEHHTASPRPEDNLHVNFAYQNEHVVPNEAFKTLAEDAVDAQNYYTEEHNHPPQYLNIQQFSVKDIKQGLASNIGDEAAEGNQNDANIHVANSYAEINFQNPPVKSEKQTRHNPIGNEFLQEAPVFSSQNYYREQEEDNYPTVTAASVSKRPNHTKLKQFSSASNIGNDAAERNQKDANIPVANSYAEINFQHPPVKSDTQSRYNPFENEEAPILSSQNYYRQQQEHNYPPATAASISNRPNHLNFQQFSHQDTKQGLPSNIGNEATKENPKNTIIPVANSYSQINIQHPPVESKTQSRHNPIVNKKAPVLSTQNYYREQEEHNDPPATAASISNRPNHTKYQQFSLEGLSSNIGNGDASVNEEDSAIPVANSYTEINFQHPSVTSEGNQLRSKLNKNSQYSSGQSGNSQLKSSQKINSAVEEEDFYKSALVRPEANFQQDINSSVEENYSPEYLNIPARQKSSPKEKEIHFSVERDAVVPVRAEEINSHQPRVPSGRHQLNFRQNLKGPVVVENFVVKISPKEKEINQEMSFPVEAQVYVLSAPVRPATIVEPSQNVPQGTDNWFVNGGSSSSVGNYEHHITHVGHVTSNKNFEHSRINQHNYATNKPAMDESSHQYQSPIHSHDNTHLPIAQTSSEDLPHFSKHIEEVNHVPDVEISVSHYSPISLQHQIQESKNFAQAGNTEFRSNKQVNQDGQSSNNFQQKIQEWINLGQDDSTEFRSNKHNFGQSPNDYRQKIEESNILAQEFGSNKQVNQFGQSPKNFHESKNVASTESNKQFGEHSNNFQNKIQKSKNVGSNKQETKTQHNQQNQFDYTAEEQKPFSDTKFKFGLENTEDKNFQGTAAVEQKLGDLNLYSYVAGDLRGHSVEGFQQQSSSLQAEQPPSYNFPQMNSLEWYKQALDNAEDSETPQGFNHPNLSNEKNEVTGDENVEQQQGFYNPTELKNAENYKSKQTYGVTHSEDVEQQEQSLKQRSSNLKNNQYNPTEVKNAENSKGKQTHDNVELQDQSSKQRTNNQNFEQQINFNHFNNLQNSQEQQVLKQVENEVSNNQNLQAFTHKQIPESYVQINTEQLPSYAFKVSHYSNSGSNLQETLKQLKSSEVYQQVQDHSEVSNTFKQKQATSQNTGNSNDKQRLNKPALNHPTTQQKGPKSYVNVNTQQIPSYILNVADKSKTNSNSKLPQETYNQQNMDIYENKQIQQNNAALQKINQKNSGNVEFKQDTIHPISLQKSKLGFNISKPLQNTKNVSMEKIPKNTFKISHQQKEIPVVFVNQKSKLRSEQKPQSYITADNKEAIQEVQSYHSSQPEKQLAEEIKNYNSENVQTPENFGFDNLSKPKSYIQLIIEQTPSRVVKLSGNKKQPHQVGTYFPTSQSNPSEVFLPTNPTFVQQNDQVGERVPKGFAHFQPSPYVRQLKEQPKEGNYYQGEVKTLGGFSPSQFYGFQPVQMQPALNEGERIVTSEYNRGDQSGFAPEKIRTYNYHPSRH